MGGSMPDRSVVCPCEIYQTCDICREETERDLVRLREDQTSRVAQDQIPALQTRNVATPTPLPEFLDGLRRAMSQE